MADVSKEELDRMLEEVVDFEITLAEDPTSPTLGLRYLQQSVAKCRNFSNRVTFYLQKVSKAEKNLKRDIKQMELDLEFKMAEKLSDDEIVRKQPSIEDRRSTATAMLKVEFEALAEKRVILLDFEQTKSMLKMKYQDLQRTAADIKLQRQMVKDDKDDQMGGGDGYVRPQVNQDRSVPNGLRPPVAPAPNPTELLDPNKRPEGFFEPLDETHATMMADFASRNSGGYNHHSPDSDLPVSSYPQVGFCAECFKPQYLTPSGESCGSHGGAATLTAEEAAEAQSKQVPKAPTSDHPVTVINYDSLLD